MKLSFVRILLTALFYATAATTFSGCGQSGNGLATEQGSMTMEEFTALKEAEQKEIAEGMQAEVGKKP